MTIEELEAKVGKLEKELTGFRDIEEIQRLQRAYGYYLERWMYKELIDLFSDSPDATLSILVGIYLGKEGIRRFFTGANEQFEGPETLHQVMQLSGIVDVNPDGITAKGRWYGFGAQALPVGKGVKQMMNGGVYAVDYVKENGTWKILKLTWNPVYTCYPENGWVKPERIAAAADVGGLGTPPEFDKPREFETRYPSGYITPFHFKHPVTGKET
ncbi:nuclear transport factor 2 family protein [Chloroflexota bacterium]